MGESLTRNALIAELRKVGFTHRSARLVIAAILEAIAERLKRDGEVQLPFGKLTVEKRLVKRAYRFGRIVRLYRKPRGRFDGTPTR